MKRIYLDFNATTPIHPEVAESMKPFLKEYFGNPSSNHWYGTQTKLMLENSRKQIALFLNCSIDEVIFTSGGTESNNTALKGIAYANRDKGKHIITSEIEHPAILEVCKYLEKNGFDISYIGVDKYGMVNPEEIQSAITSSTILISIMHANNEVGTIQPIQEISKIARENNILFHTDAAQSAGKIPVDVEELGVDLLSIAGHKLYAPKGIGALYIRRGTNIEKLIHGADHERNMRAGTENILEIIGLGKACELAKAEGNIRSKHLKSLRDQLYGELTNKLEDIHLLGHPEKRLPNTLSIGFAGLDANIILSELQNIAASAGAACHADQVDISHVLTAMKIPDEIAMGAIRFSTGFSNTSNEISSAAKQIIITHNNLKNTSASSYSPGINLNEVKLTQFTQGLGCACKLKPQSLEKVLEKIPEFKNPNIMVDMKSSDDAAVYKLNRNTAIVETVDFFTPVVDDPYSFGAIAAANSLSDIYAMGAKPLYALNIVGFPSTRLPMTVLEEILKGASDKVKEAGIGILGGHTIDDTEPKFGLVVTGIVHPGKILRNSGAKIGDALILTKPLGTGIISTAMKKGIVPEETISLVVNMMSRLNKTTAEVAEKHPVSACTDISGYGLLGHLREMLKASKVNATLQIKNIPLFDKAVEYAANDIIPGGTRNNLNYVSDFLISDAGISANDKILLADAQTSGGLLLSIPEKYSDKLITELKNSGVEDAVQIGQIDAPGEGYMSLSNA